MSAGEKAIPSAPQHLPLSTDLLLQRHIHNIGERGIAVKDVDVEPFVLEGPHRIKPFFLTRATATHPNLDSFELPLGLRLAKPIDDAAKSLLHIGEIRDRAADNDI